MKKEEYCDGYARAKNFVEHKAECSGHWIGGDHTSCSKTFNWFLPSRGPNSHRRYGRCAECAERQWYYERRMKWEKYRKEVDEGSGKK